MIMIILLSADNNNDNDDNDNYTRPQARTLSGDNNNDNENDDNYTRQQARTLSDDVPTGRDMFTQGRGTVRSPDIGKCGEWCWKVNVQNRHISCTDICVGKENQHPALKVFVGGVLPKMVGSGSTLFQLHQDKKWIDAGSFFTFGRRFSRSVNLLRRSSWVRHAVDSTTHYIAELEVTNVLIEEDWSAEEPLVARLVSGCVTHAIASAMLGLSLSCPF